MCGENNLENDKGCKPENRDGGGGGGVNLLAEGLVLLVTSPEEM